MKRTILIACVMATGYGIQAQEAWSLQKCIEYALQKLIRKASRKVGKHQNGTIGSSRSIDGAFS